LGVIRTQTIKGTAYTYFGAVLGIVTTIIFPRCFSKEQIGLLNVLVAFSLVFAQFANLGFDNITIRLFPYFRNDSNKHNGFLYILGKVLIIGTLFSITLFLILKPFIVESTDKAYTLFNRYSFYIIPLIIFTLLFISFDVYSRVLYKSVRGSFLKEFIQRILIIIAIAVSYFFSLGFDQFVLLYVICLSLPTLIIIWLIWKDGQLSFKPSPGFVTPELKKNMYSVGVFGIITVFSTTVMATIDKIMLQSMLGDLAWVGVYSILFYFGTIITMPSRALTKISSTVVAEAWKNDDIKTVKDIYYKSCLTQMIFSAILFIGIWANINNIFILLPSDYAIGKFVIFWVCIGSFIDMSTGINNTIIATSKYYKAQSLFMTIFVIIVIISNYFFIPIWGIIGAAIANAVSLFLFNLMRWIFLWKKFNLQPFNYKYLLVLLFSLIAFLPGYYLPAIKPFFVDIIVRSGMIFIIFSMLIYFSKVSSDINDRVHIYISWILKKIVN
jgi:O-antigen/teichoic acid export membrane protein